MIVEEPPLICYYFVNEPQPLAYYPPFWTGTMLPWF